jgi:phosphoribosylanthranilate isomerase
MGADALGINFVPGTPRYVGESANLVALLESIPPFVTSVGVCVSPDHVVPEALPHLDVLQTYDHVLGAQSDRQRIVIPAFRIRSEADLDLIEPVSAGCKARTILLDAYHESALGGAGITFSWDLAVKAQARYDVRIILAGGLTPDNVAEAIWQVKPYAVDVSSGVEAIPGRKDHGRMRAFIEAVRSLR